MQFWYNAAIAPAGYNSLERYIICRPSQLCTGEPGSRTPISVGNFHNRCLRVCFTLAHYNCCLDTILAESWCCAWIKTTMACHRLDFLLLLLFCTSTACPPIWVNIKCTFSQLDNHVTHIQPTSSGPPGPTWWPPQFMAFQQKDGLLAYSEYVSKWVHV